VRDFELRLPDVDGASGERDGALDRLPHAALDEHGPSLRIQAPDRHYVPKLLQRDGLAGYEPETMACFLAGAELLGGPVFDIGANIGVFSLVASALLDNELVAFEPTPELARLFTAITDANDLDVRLEEVALGASEGTATFWLSSVTDSSNSLLAGFRPSDTSIEVKVETLDGYLARTGLTSRLLKIDTEATEPDVLRGGMGYLREHRPWLICEVLARRSEAELEELLEPLGYTWYQITGELPLAPRREIFGDRAYRFNNWLFAPEPPPTSYWDRVDEWKRALAACLPVVPPSPPPGVNAASSSKPRRRGVYGRKKMLAGILSGLVAGFTLGRLSRPETETRGHRSYRAERVHRAHGEAGRAPERR
jgi:FkbM family methyltransferase